MKTKGVSNVLALNWEKGSIYVKPNCRGRKWKWKGLFLSIMADQREFVLRTSPTITPIDLFSFTSLSISPHSSSSPFLTLITSFFPPKCRKTVYRNRFFCFGLWFKYYPPRIFCATAMAASFVKYMFGFCIVSAMLWTIIK